MTQILDDPALNAFLALSPERAFAQADKIDALAKSGGSLPPLGVSMT